MNKGLAIGIIIVLLIVGFGVYKVTFNNTSKGNQETSQNNAVGSTKTDVIGEESKESSSLRELLSSGQNQRCTFSTTTDATTTDGTIFAASGKMRSDISTTTSGKTVMSHMILSNNELSVWMDGESNGMKMMFDPEKIQGEESKQKTVDLDEKVDYRCNGWVGDPSLFDVPTSVTFTNLDSIEIPTTGVSTGDSEDVMGRNESSCAACDSLSGEAKTQCKTALGCE